MFISMTWFHQQTNNPERRHCQSVSKVLQPLSRHPENKEDQGPRAQLWECGASIGFLSCIFLKCAYSVWQSLFMNCLYVKIQGNFLPCEMFSLMVLISDQVLTP